MQDGLVLWLDARAQRQLMKDGQSKSIWKDLSGNGNDGQLMNFDFTEDSGWVDGGLRLDGVDDYVRTAYLGTLNNLTLELAIYSPEIQGQVVWAAGDDTVIIYADGRSYIKSNTGTKVAHSGFELNNKQTTLTIVYNINTQKAYYYQDGILIYSTLLPTNSTEFNFKSLNIFANYSGGQNKKGEIYYVRIYNRALTDEEILQNYRATHFLLEPKTFTSTSYYNFYDLNRVEINTLATKDLAEVLRGDINLEDIDFDRNMKALPFTDTLNRVEGNINILGNKLYKPKGWITPKLEWAYNQPFSYEDANRLERNLLLLYNYAKGNIDKIPHCGQIYVGEEVI